ncbi:MAG: hypothetical protein M0R21_12445 [Lentimicrobiaceae bacterium]|jgi:hypothetical protein|nr:hypothetical protein [Lentimicrobiaceae bacterium]
MQKKRKQQSNLFTQQVAPVVQQSRSAEAAATKKESLKELSIRLRNEKDI